jgi:hypothetical protein
MPSLGPFCFCNALLGLGLCHALLGFFHSATPS